MVIDTNIFIEYLRAKNKRNTALYKIPNNSILHISTITLFELFIGATNEEKWYDIVTLTEDLIIIPVNKEIALESAKIYHQLKSENKLLDFRDIIIAATAIVNNLEILTLNKGHFSRISKLKFFSKS